MRWSFEDRRVVTIETALQLDHSHPACLQPDYVIMAICFPCRFPILNERPILHVVQHVTNKFSFLAHRRGKLTARPFNRTAKKATVVKFLFRKAMRAELVSLCF